MKKIIILFSAILLIGTGTTYAQAFDTTITVRKTYHLQQADGATVDSIVEYSYVKHFSTPQITVAYPQVQTTNPKPINWYPVVQDLTSTQMMSPYMNSWGGYDFNDTHPELKKGETFFMNINAKGSKEKLEYLKEIYQVNARLGATAYDRNGKKISGQVPVFFRW